MENFSLEGLLPAYFREEEKKLARFVHFQHSTQTRKYTGLPYIVHLLAVAELVFQYTSDEIATATALCHDLFEDTACLENCLRKGLQEAGYEGAAINKIIGCTWELTDRYTKKQYPRLNRRERKKLEAERLKNISPVAASVKLADLTDNLADLLKNDTDFAAVYLREARLMLPHLEKGDRGLYDLFSKLAADAAGRLEGHPTD